MENQTIFAEIIKAQLENKYISDNCTGKLTMLNLNGFSWGIMRDKNTLEVGFEDGIFEIGYTEADGEFFVEGTETTHKEGLYFQVTIGFKTPKGYISTKKLPVDFDYLNGKELTEAQVIELMQYQTDAVKNTFDPFYKENEAKRRNAAAWNYVAQNYITDPYCTK